MSDSPLDRSELLRLADYAASMQLLPAPGTRTVGRWLSRSRNPGMEYEESRPYQDGDDARTIDWRVTARTNRVHTKIYRQEQERSTALWVDLRPTMHFATRGALKSNIAIRAAALLAWTALLEGDRLALLVERRDRTELIPAARGRRAAVGILDVLLQDRGDEGPPGTDSRERNDVTTFVRHLGAGVRQLILVSDFHDLDDSALASLRQHCRSKAVVAVMIYDGIEKNLPPPDRYRLLTQRGESILDTTSPQLRQSHAQRFVQRCERLRKLTQGAGSVFIECATTGNIVAVLRKRLSG
jgi:uncharacterized protein (DUF58 family)